MDIVEKRALCIAVAILVLLLFNLGCIGVPSGKENQSLILGALVDEPQVNGTNETNQSLVYSPPVLIEKGEKYEKYQNYDGSNTLVIYPQAKNYQLDNGSYEPIDLSVQTVSKTGFAKGVEKNKFKSYFGTYARDDVQFEIAGKNVKYSPDGAARVEGTANGNEI
ncbi:MAG: hypothetical protein ABIH99_00020, partial [Candidatus Micrarchaeota archaeon]